MVDVTKLVRENGTWGVSAVILNSENDFPLKKPLVFCCKVFSSFDIFFKICYNSIN